MTKIILFLIIFTACSIILTYAETSSNSNSGQNNSTTSEAEAVTEDKTTKDTSSENSSSSKDTCSTSTEISTADNPTKIDIKVSNIIAKINPQTEITFPTGSFSEHFKHRFNNLNIIFNFNYNFLANELSGKISFEYPLKYLNPYISFSDSIDFESYVKPSIVNDYIQLVPTDKFITRNRTMEGGLEYRITKNFILYTSLNYDDIFRGDLSTATIIENGVDLTTQFGAEYNSMRVVLPKSKLMFKGLYYKTSFNFKHRNKFNNPVSIDHNENFLLTPEITKNWYIEQGINMGFPIKVWENTLASFYTLGGFDTLKGYPEKSINAFRYISASSTIHRRITLNKEIKKKILKNYYIKTSIFDLYLFYNQCIVQDKLPMYSSVKYFPSLGTGSSIIISGENNRHLKVSIFIAQALKQGHNPIVYLKSSFFQFEK